MQVQPTLIGRKQVLSNSGIASISVVLIALVIRGIDRCLDSKESTLVIALIDGVIGHYACCNGDTWSSELDILCKAEPRIITTFKSAAEPAASYTLVTAADLCGSLMDSFLGATVQYSGFYSVHKKTVAYPLDVISRRMHMVGWSHADSIVIGQVKEALQYNGMIDAFKKTVRHGVGALYKGLVPNSVKVVPSIAIAFVTYEVV
uniref:Uncharacterized protein n=1 Tax=Zea mays TaxID=4577 RepID=A0A804QJP3_MAIZE